MDFVLSLLPEIEHFHMMGYWIAFLAALSETTIGIGLFIPGSTAILFMGALAAKGYFDLGDLLLFAVAGAIIGDNINYFIGRRYGSEVFSKGFWFIKPIRFEKGEEFFKRHGSKSVFIGRFIPSLKEIIPLIAGIFSMRRLSFMVWNILGAIGWSLVWILPGYFFSQSLNLAEVWLTRAGFFLVIFITAFIVFYIFKIILVRKGKEFFSLLFSVWLSVKQAVIENSEIQKFAKRHKTFFQFIYKRLDKSSFNGLPLTLFSLALLYALFLFGGIIEDIINSDVIISADIRVANLLAVFRNPALTKFFLWITLLGKWKIVIVFISAAVLILGIWKKRVYIIPLLLTVAGSEIFTSIGKSVFRRARPDTAMYSENSFSFPSGHATIAVAFYGFITYLLIKSFKQWSKKINTFFIGFAVILLIGFSRLYLGVHYVSDVWGGYLAGAIWLIIAISLSEYFLYGKKPKSNALRQKSAKKIFVSGGIVVASIGIYIIFALSRQIPVPVTSQETNQIMISDAMDIFSSNRLKYTETLLGNAQEPISFIIIAKNSRELAGLFEQAGWVLADKVNISNIVKSARAAFWKSSYPKAPMTPDFWNAEVYDFGFEKATGADNIRVRHHARFWKTNYIAKNGSPIYVGTASFDNNIKWGITHRINPDIDTEREFLFSDLQKTGKIIKTQKQSLVNPKLGSNFSGDLFFTDGSLYLISIVD